MERNKTIEWQVSSDHIRATPLGYKVEVAEDALHRRVCFVSNTFAASDAFSYDDGMMPNPNFVAFPASGIATPIAGKAVRLDYESEKLMKFMAVTKNSKLYRVAPDAGRIIDGMELNTTGVRSIAINETNNDIWITTATGMVHIVPMPFDSSTISAVPIPLDCLAAIPDGFRKSFWEIRPNEIRLKRFNGQTVKYWKLDLEADEVMSFQIMPSTGNAYFIISTSDLSASSSRFMLYCEPAGSISTIDEPALDSKIGCISRWTFNSVLTGGTGSNITRWTGVTQNDMGDVSSSGVSSISSISAKFGDAIYIVDQDDNMLSFNTVSMSMLWKKQLPVTGVKSINAMFGCQKPGRPILFNDNDSAGIIRDFVDEGVAYLGVSLPGTGDSLSGFGSAHKPAIAFIRVSPVYEYYGIVYGSSSSSISSASSVSSASESSISSISSRSSKSSSMGRTSSSSLSSPSSSSSTEIRTSSASSPSTAAMSSSSPSSINSSSSQSPSSVSSESSGYFVDVTNPAQTSATNPFVITASSEAQGGGSPAWRAFDHLPVSPSNYPIGENCWRTSLNFPSSPPHWIMIDFGAGNLKTLRYYNIHCSAHELGSYIQQFRSCPTGWAFQGSNDGVTFVTLDTRQLQDAEWGPGSANKYFGFANTTAYRYYRLYITHVHRAGGSNMGPVQIEELRYSE